MDFKKAKIFLSFKLRRISKVLDFVFSRIIKFFQRLKGAYKILSIWEKRIVVFLFLIFVIGLVFLSRDIYFKDTKTAPTIGGSISFAEVGEPKLINPLFAKSSQDKDIVNLVFSGLFYQNEKRELVPDLAEKWEISEDKKTYTFHLSPAAVWHDGVPVIVDDLMFTASLISDPNYSGPLRGLFENVILEKVDDNTLKFVLQEPYAPFLSSLTFGILPSHILSNIPLEEMEENEFNLFPIGAGPYKIKKTNLTNKKKQIVLERNPEHLKRAPLISEITFKFYDDFEKALKAYNTGEATALADIPHDYIKQAQEIKDLNFYKLTPSSYMVLFFNLENKSLKDKSFREAVATGINKDEIIEEAISGQGEKVIGPLLPDFDFLGYTDEVKKIEYNLEAAKAALEKKKISSAFDLVVVEDENSLKIAELVKNQLAEIGIEINVISADTLSIQTDYIFPRKYDLLLFGENLGADPDPYPFWHSSQIGTGKLNFSGFKNSEVDTLLEEARTNDDWTFRKERYEKFHKIIAEEIPAVFLFRPIDFFAINNNIKDVKDAKVITCSDKFFQVQNWYIKVGREKK